MRPIVHGGASFIAALCLAMALGVTATAFTLVDASVVRPFGLNRAADLIVLWETDPARPQDLIELSLPSFGDLQRAPAFQSMAAFGSSHWAGIGRLRTEADTSASSGQARVRGDTDAGAPHESFVIAPRAVSRDFFRTLGVSPLVGREFTADDLQRAQSPPVILSHALWERRFGSSRDVLQATLLIDNEPFQIVGVMPRGFAFPDAPDAWISVERALGDVFEENRMDVNQQRALGVLEAVGRLAPGATREQAQVQLNTIQRQIGERYFPQRPPVVITMTPFADFVFGRLGARVWIAVAMTIAVLLFACANVSAIRTAHLRNRRGELAARLCFGATRIGLLRQLLTETLPLVIAAALAAIGVAFALELWLRQAPVVVTSGIDLAQSRTFTLTSIAIAALGAWVLVSLPAALSSLRKLTPAAVTLGSRTVARGSRATNAVLLAQAALAVCLVAMATGAFQLFVSLAATDVGFTTRGVTAVDVSVPDWKYEEPSVRDLLEQRLIAGLKQIPGVRTAAGVSVRPFRFGEIADGLLVRRPENPSPDANVPASRVVVSQDYFEAMGITLEAGRGFTETDRTSKTRVAIVTRSLARAVWGSADPLGREFEYATMRGWLRAQVVGVVEDVRSRVLTSPTLEVYVVARDGATPMSSFVLRHGPGQALTDAVLRSALRAVDPDLVLERAQTTGDVLDHVLAPARLLSTAMTMLGVTGLVLLALGIFGAAATVLRSSRREVGIRQAVGATPFVAARAPLRTLLSAVGLGVIAGSVLAPGAVGGLAAMGVAQDSAIGVALVAGAAAVVLAAATAIAINLQRTTAVPPAELLRIE